LKPYFGDDFDYDRNLISAWAGLRALVNEKDIKIKPFEMQEYINNPLSYPLKWALSYCYKRISKILSKKGSSARLARNHVIEVCPQTGLVSLMGGKWTSFRAMGEETVENILSQFPLKFP
jgi:glycerol-3-phosphate dehydrogenase